MMQCLSVTDLSRLREVVTDVTGNAGFEADRAARFTLAVNEVATNAIQHGGGSAEVTIWFSGTRLIVQIEDTGPGIPPDVTATRPGPDALNGRGLWLVNQLCDEVDVLTGGAGTQVRLVMVAP